MRLFDTEFSNFLHSDFIKAGLGVAAFIGYCYFSYKINDFSVEIGNDNLKSNKNVTPTVDRRGKTERILTGEPKTLFQNMVYNLYLSSTRYINSDYYKADVAKKIYDKAKCADNLSDADKSYAMAALSAIASSISSNYYQNQITDYINKIYDL